MAQEDADFFVLHNPGARHDQNKVHKPSVSSASHGSAGGPTGGLAASPNPRSCVTCRRRKVKCDKKARCTNCVRAGIECVYPGPGRAARRPRTSVDGELMERLRKLEGVVMMLGSQVGEGEGEGGRPGGELGFGEEALRKERGGEQALRKERGREKDNDGEKAGMREKDKDREMAGEMEGEMDRDKSEEEMSFGEKMRRAKEQLWELKKQQWEKEKSAHLNEETGLEKRFGRLVVDEGRSRYINPSFWASLSDEVENLKDTLYDSEEEEGDNDYIGPETSHGNGNNQGFVFSFSSQNMNMLQLHPPRDHVSLYWGVFRENVDPLVKVIHAPTMEPTILEAKDRLGTISRGLECLMFAIYYGAVTSMSDADVPTQFGEEKAVLLARYRFGIEQALARAEFLQTDEIIVLQAFVIFLICLRRNDNARVIWTLTGLVVRMAQSLGLHKDGAHYGLPPFQIEMRRRLWWQICILDSRASEEHGADPTIFEHSSDTKMPINCNDDDLEPSMASLPEPRTGCTQMTFGIIRFEISQILRRLAFIPPHPRRHGRFFGGLSVERKEQWVKSLHERLEQQYLKDTDMSVPLYWVVVTLSRLFMSMIWLIVYHPFQRRDGGSSLPQEVRDKLFLTSLDNVEYSVLLETDEKTKRWGWLFRTYVQWHAIAFMLSEMTVRTTGPEVERAWKAINFLVNRRWDDISTEAQPNQLKGHLWKPLRKLMAKASLAREEALQKENQERDTQHASTRPDGTTLMGFDFGVDRPFPEAATNPTSHAANPTPHTAIMPTNTPNTQDTVMSPTSWNTLISDFSLPSLPDPTLTTATATAHLPGAASTALNGNTAEVSAPYNLPSPPNPWHFAAHEPPENSVTNLAHPSFPSVQPLPPTSGLDGAIPASSGDTHADAPADGVGVGTWTASGAGNGLDWTAFDNMVQLYGMDIDGGLADSGQPFPEAGAFAGLTPWY